MVENGVVAAEDMGVAESEKMVGKREENGRVDAIVEVYFHFVLFYYFCFLTCRIVRVYIHTCDHNCMVLRINTAAVVGVPLAFSCS